MNSMKALIFFLLLAGTACAQFGPNSPNQPNLPSVQPNRPMGGGIVTFPNGFGGQNIYDGQHTYQTQPHGLGGFNIYGGDRAVVCRPNGFGGVNCN
jgi:hypothetical protein